MIVDASVAFKWIYVEEGSERAAELLGRDDVFAPVLLLMELGNAFWKKKHRREQFDREAFPLHLAMLNSLVKIVDVVDVIPAALEIALTLDHPIYDCVYLALAVQREDVLVTADQKFANKVLASSLAGSIQLL